MFSAFKRTANAFLETANLELSDMRYPKELKDIVLDSEPDANGNARFWIFMAPAYTAFTTAFKYAVLGTPAEKLAEQLYNDPKPQIRVEAEMDSDGKPHGIYRQYYAEGSVNDELHYDHGTLLPAQP